MTIEQLYELYRQHPSVQTDTRKLQPGDIFFALKGPHFNANDFATQALALGASYAIVDDGIEKNNERIIRVPDTLRCLQELALFHRKHFSIPFIAITGSNGKTTTKELIHAVLSKKYHTYTTKGNLNNHIGIPLTLLSIKKNAEMAVIEMGANHLHEIEGYCRYTLPTHGIITNCGKAHLEGFGSIEGVRKGKGELFDFLRANNGTAFIMQDYDYLREMSKGIKRIVTYGEKDAGIIGKIEKSDPFLTVGISVNKEPFHINTRLVGVYNLPNVLAAVAVGKEFGVDNNEITGAMETYIPSNSRSQLVEKDGNHIILDAYNANPGSMKAAIENFASMHVPNKVLILGGMAELGTDSLLEHELIIELIDKYSWEKVVLVGGDFLKISHPYISLANSEEAGKWYRRQSFHHHYLLIKGSRSMQMEKVLNDGPS